MRIILIAAAAALSFVSSLAVAPAAAAPKDDMCEFVRLITAEGVPAAVAFTEELAELWAPGQRAKLGVVVGAELEKFNYRGGQVYRIAHLPDVVEEYLVTLNLAQNGSVYLRVFYEGNGTGDFVFLNIDFKSSYQDAIAVPFLQEPEPMECRGLSGLKE